MRAELEDLSAMNLADSVFRQKDVERAQKLVRYYKHPWHSANHRMKAYYLLGRTLADMGEAPQAIEAYLTAIECADTASRDCDFRTLRGIYGQMATVYHDQNLPQDELEAGKRCNYYSWLLKDTLAAINGHIGLLRGYYLMGDTDQVLRVTQEGVALMRALGQTAYAARAQVTATYIYIQRAQYQQAGQLIREIREASGMFDSQGRLIPGCEMFYYTIGCYFDGIHQLDSAEHYFREVLSAGHYEAAYQGLLSVYKQRQVPDSMAKYAQLYTEANDAMHRRMNSKAVHDAAAMYNYNRYLQEARQKEQTATQRAYIIIILILMLLVMTYFHQRLKQNKKKKEAALAFFYGQYQTVKELLSNVQKEKEEIESNIELVLTKKQDIITELQAQKDHLEQICENLQSKNSLSNYYASDIVQQTLDLSIHRKRILTLQQVQELYAAFRRTYPHFVQFVDKHTKTFTENEWYVCILLDLGLRNNDICFLLGFAPSRISGIIGQINHVLFAEEGTGNIQSHLRAVIHPA